MGALPKEHESAVVQFRSFVFISVPEFFQVFVM